MYSQACRPKCLQASNSCHHTHVYTHVHTHVHAHVYTYGYGHAHAQVCAHVYTHAYTERLQVPPNSLPMHKSIHISIHMSTHMFIHMPVHMSTRTHTSRDCDFGRSGVAKSQPTRSKITRMTCPRAAVATDMCRTLLHTREAASLRLCVRTCACILTCTRQWLRMCVDVHLRCVCACT